MKDYQLERPKDLGKLVVVGGPGGSGSSTIAKLLAKHWELHRIDAGEIMRNKTQQKQLNHFITNNASRHPEIDRRIDHFLVRMSYSPNMLIEGKFFAAIATSMGIPCTIKIWIGADLTTRVHRILQREGHVEPGEKLSKQNSKFIEFRNRLMKRQSNDIKRCRKLYHVDLTKPELFNDVVLDTTKLNVSYTIKKLFQLINENDTLRKRFSPKYLKY